MKLCSEDLEVLIWEKSGEMSSLLEWAAMERRRVISRKAAIDYCSTQCSSWIREEEEEENGGSEVRE